VENKILYIIVAVVIIFAVSAGVYFTMGDRIFNVNPEKNNVMPLDSELKNQKSDFSGSENFEDIGDNNIGSEHGIKDAKEEERNVLANDDFSIILPQGWQGSPAPMGASAMAIKFNEEINDPAARKINFKSYFAISFDTLGDRSREEYVQYVKDSLNLLSPEVSFTQEKQIMVGKNDAYAVEIGIVQQGANFKVLMILVWGEEGDIWSLSLNTVEEKWDDYRSLFYQVALGFKIK
jgi:hypothetical protein